MTDYLPVDIEAVPAPLTADQTDPLITSAGILGGQLVTATLNVAFDNAGIGTGGSFAPGSLATLRFTNGCVAAGLAGRTVGEVLAFADCAIRSPWVDPQAGCGVPVGVTLSDLSDALGALNENFVVCDTNLGCLELP